MVRRYGVQIFRVNIVQHTAGLCACVHACIYNTLQASECVRKNEFAGNRFFLKETTLSKCFFSLLKRGLL